MAQKLLYPIGLQAFSGIREGGYTYVDKTDYIHQLVSSGKYYFLSRPRRFGKSLLLSTIDCFFSGRKDLFDGLAISRYEYDWEPNPVLHLDFTAKDYKEVISLDEKLNSLFEPWEKIYGCEKDGRALEERFEYIIRRAHELTGKKVVILIDEYDKPLLETVDQPHLQKAYRNKLRAVYGNLKKMDEHIRFAMLTGVTKFGQLSIFSDLNNLQDISLDEEYAGICGITEEELRQYFNSGIEEFATKLNKTSSEIYNLLKANYDGYHFAPYGGSDIYNPFSLLNTLQKKRFGDYWFQSGTPNFLLKVISSGNIKVKDLYDYNISINALSSVSLDLSDLIPVLYQSGYLTIKSTDTEFDMVRLGFPNAEVERGFFDRLLPMYSHIKDGNTAFAIHSFVMDVRQGRAEDFMVRLQSLFSDFNHDGIDLKAVERHYQDVIFIVMKLMGFYTNIEYKTAAGRIDMVVTTPEYIYVFEFKLDRTPQEAIDQINSKDYMLPFRADGRTLIKIGVNFSSAIRSIEDWIIEKV